MNLPDFFCIGAQKSGTTLLQELLKEIEDIYLPIIKEVHFFDVPNRFDKGLEWYERNYFFNAKKDKKIGEITPSYIFIDDVPKKIFDSLGKDIKFIIILRNPIQRAYSQYTMKYRTKEEKYSFEDALVLESVRTRRNLEYKKRYSYLQRGLYSSQIRNYLKYFEKKQFLFIEFDDFIKNQDSTIKDICNFLEINKINTIISKRVHSTNLSLGEKLKFSILNKNYNIFNILKKTGYPDMKISTKKLLQKYYEDDIIELERIISKDLSKWLQ